ncbi:MAG: hypothetical protein FWD33_04290 [Alphaproteobacteria bacterium]|nr:hypothetical protein [Alphaproteobacteria bacterium]
MSFKNITLQLTTTAVAILALGAHWLFTRDLNAPVSTNPDKSYETQIENARVKIAKDFYNQATLASSQIRNKDEDIENDLLVVMRLFLDSGQYVGALSAFNTIRFRDDNYGISSDSNLAQAHYLAGLANENLYEFEKARDNFRMAVQYGMLKASIDHDRLSRLVTYVKTSNTNLDKANEIFALAEMHERMGRADSAMANYMIAARFGSKQAYAEFKRLFNADWLENNPMALAGPDIDPRLLATSNNQPTH